MRAAVRAVILRGDRLLLVNAWPGRTDLYCCPGGGIEDHASMPENLAREVHEETGLTVRVGAPCLVNEFHDPDRPFHQIEVFFRCEVTAGETREDWRDPEAVVVSRRWVTRAEAEGMVAARALRPARLPRIAWEGGFDYDPLEPVIR